MRGRKRGGERRERGGRGGYDSPLKESRRAKGKLHTEKETERDGGGGGGGRGRERGRERERESHKIQSFRSRDSRLIIINFFYYYYSFKLHLVKFDVICAKELISFEKYNNDNDFIGYNHIIFPLLNLDTC